LQPDIVVAPSDTITELKQVSKKRIDRSVTRSLEHLDAFRHVHQGTAPVFGAVHGRQLLSERERSAKETAARSLDGYVVSALGMVDESEYSKKLGTASGLMTLERFGDGAWLQTSLAHLDPNKPRLVYGLSHPVDVIKAIDMGVDVLESSFAHHVTECFAALSLSLDPPVFHVDELADKKNARDMAPLKSGCECMACTAPYSRAYIHHLVNAHEMLASVLLQR
jgi:queuine tRNA-ribosyltransferase subunit QTRTD1